MPVRREKIKAKRGETFDSYRFHNEQKNKGGVPNKINKTMREKIKNRISTKDQESSKEEIIKAFERFTS